MEEDNGNYTCELREPQSRVLRQVTHYLFVRGNMSHLLLNSDVRRNTRHRILFTAVLGVSRYGHAKYTALCSVFLSRSLSLIIELNSDGPNNMCYLRTFVAKAFGLHY